MTPKENLTQLALDYLGQKAFLESLNESRGAEVAKMIRVGLRQLAFRTTLQEIADLKDAHPHLEKLEVAKVAHMAEDELKSLRIAAGLEEPVESPEGDYVEQGGGEYDGLLDAVTITVNEQLKPLAEFVEALSNECDAVKDAVVGLCELAAEDEDE